MPDNNARMLAIARARTTRERRRYLPAPVRLFIAASFGVLVAVLAAYLLRKMGF
jgi:hypothetical protein